MTSPDRVPVGVPVPDETAAREVLPFREPEDADAPIYLTATGAYGWISGYTRAIEDVREALLAACNHSDMHWGTWEPDKCPFPGCHLARRLLACGDHR